MLEETNNFIIIPSLGSLVEGYLFIVSKKHYNNMNELGNIEKEEYFNLINKYRNKFINIYCEYPIIFEHGYIEDNNTSSVSHAHTHIVNYNFKDELSIINYLNFNIINGIDDIDKKRNYIMYISIDKKIYVSYDFNNVSQLMRVLIAKDLNIENKYNWKNNKFITNIKLTINKLK